MKSNVISLSAKKAQKEKETDEDAHVATDAFASEKAQGKLKYAKENENGDYVIISPDSLVDLNQVVCLNAHAGNYKEVFMTMGASKVLTFDLTSSAGDWTFVVKIANEWYMATQSNGYPRHSGYSYWISDVSYDEDHDVDIDMYESIEHMLQNEDDSRFK